MPVRSLLRNPEAPALSERIGHMFRRRSKRALEALMTSSLVRWTWSDLGEHKFAHVLTDYRPSDTDTVREMMAGRYLLAAKLIDTGGVSPFAVKTASRNWIEELHGFSWLRHFRDVRDEAERKFARTLTLDWIGRYRRFDRTHWDITLTAQRVMNWLRHLDLLLDDATPAQRQTITRVLNQQIQSLRVRAGMLQDPVEALFARMALLGAALSRGEETGAAETISMRLEQLHASLGAQIDADGLHRSRNTALQVAILTELLTLRHALSLRQSSERLANTVERMQSAIVQLTLGTGEPAYFNGCGQLPVDLLYALHAQAQARVEQDGILSGYGILRTGPAVIIADSGQVPSNGFSRTTHAGALSFEFSHGNELIVGNCGPAPSELDESAHLFRLGAAHSCPTIGHHSAAVLVRKGGLAGTLTAYDANPKISAHEEESALYIKNGGFFPRYHVLAERWLTLIAQGNTLVGKDRFHSPRGDVPEAPVTVRFHLGPGVTAERNQGEDLVHLETPSGARWHFLWEGARAELDDSVRQSAYFGFYKTRQIVLETTLKDNLELVWVLTRQG